MIQCTGKKALTIPQCNPIRCFRNGKARTTAFRPSIKLKSVISNLPCLLQWMKNRNEINSLVEKKEMFRHFKIRLKDSERTGMTLRRVVSIYGIWKSNLSTPQLDTIQEEMEPRLTSFSDSIIQNTALFQKIETVYNDPAKKT